MRATNYSITPYSDSQPRWPNSVGRVDKPMVQTPYGGAPLARKAQCATSSSMFGTGINPSQWTATQEHILGTKPGGLDDDQVYFVRGSRSTPNRTSGIHLANRTSGIHLANRNQRSSEEGVTGHAQRPFSPMTTSASQEVLKRLARRNRSSWI